jgi:hypothetical protein
MGDNFKAVVDYVIGDDESELGKTKAELNYALHSLEREIAICSRTQREIDRVRAAFIRYLQNENECNAGPTGKACHSHKCGCAIDLQIYIDDEPILERVSNG